MDYAKLLTFLISLQTKAPKALELLMHIAGDIAQLVALISTNAATATADMMSQSTSWEPSEEEKQLESQLTQLIDSQGGVVASFNSGVASNAAGSGMAASSSSGNDFDITPTGGSARAGLDLAVLRQLFELLKNSGMLTSLLTMLLGLLNK